jgi:hypothetical protein
MGYGRRGRDEGYTEEREGKGREGKGREGKGREGKGGREERRRKMTWPPPKKNSWIRHCFKLMDKKPGVMKSCFLCV